MTYHAGEISTDSSHELIVDQSERMFNIWFALALENLGEEVETYSSGTVEAESPEEAMDKIRAGNWQYSQKL